MLAEKAGPLARWLGTASLVATGLAFVLALLAVGPVILGRPIDGGLGRRTWLLDAYMFVAIAAPVVGTVTLAAAAWARRGAIIAPGQTRPNLMRAGWSGVLAVSSALLWAVLFPWVFFATGGTR